MNDAETGGSVLRASNDLRKDDLAGLWRVMSRLE